MFAAGRACEDPPSAARGGDAGFAGDGLSCRRRPFFPLPQAAPSHRPPPFAEDASASRAAAAAARLRRAGPLAPSVVYNQTSAAGPGVEMTTAGPRRPPAPPSDSDSVVEQLSENEEEFLSRVKSTFNRDLEADLRKYEEFLDETLKAGTAMLVAFIEPHEREAEQLNGTYKRSWLQSVAECEESTKRVKSYAEAAHGSIGHLLESLEQNHLQLRRARIELLKDLDGLREEHKAQLERAFARIQKEVSAAKTSAAQARKSVAQTDSFANQLKCLFRF